MQYKLVLAVLAGIAIASCRNKPVYPSEPVITYKDFLRYGNSSNPDSVELVVSFTDNEGDIFLAQADTQGILKGGNLYMDYYYWDTAGIIDHWDTIIPQLSLNKLIFPNYVRGVLPNGDKAEPVKGLIYVKEYRMDSPSHDVPIFLHKKIKFVVYMYDKALHKSNTIETPAITFP